jgi:heme/copper-type cytochrome/quinol oxidase subunit 2
MAHRLRGSLHSNSRGRLRAYLCPFVVCMAIVCAAISTEAQTETGATPVEIKVTARQFEFEPKVITVQKGKPVRLLITSADVQHGFSIEELGINRKLKANAVTVVEFTPMRVGRFPFECSVMCGSGHDEMAGELVVTEEQTSATGNVQVKFDDNAAGVVIVEAGGERLRIDTRAKTVTRLDQPETQTEAPSPVVAEVAHQHTSEHEPYDYRLVNVPTPKRVLKGSINLYFTHRFAQPIRPLGQSDQDLLGLDSFAISSFGGFYGVTDRLYVSAYRSPICQPGLCKTIELGIGYHLLDEDGRSPIALSSYVSVEGDDNFKRNHNYNLQLMVARSASKYVHLFFSPALHLNINTRRRFDPQPTDFFPREPLANQFNQDQHGASFGFGANARIRPTISLLFEYTPRVGFKLGQVEAVRAAGTNKIIGFRNDSEAEIGFGIEKDVGRHTFSLTFSNTQTTTTSRYNSSNQVLPPSRFMIGFNLYRRFLK